MIVDISSFINITAHVTRRLMRMTRPLKRENNQPFVQWANANALEQILGNRVHSMAPALLVYVAVLSPPENFEQVTNAVRYFYLLLQKYSGT